MPLGAESKGSEGVCPMLTDQNKAVIQRWFDAINKKDLFVCDKIADETYAFDFILHDPGFPKSADPIPGPTGAKQFVRQLISNSPDVHLGIEDMIAEGDKVAFRFTVNSTDVTTGKQVSLLVISIIRFVDGKFAEEWELDVPGEW
jgi:ketosteroid isomerase-like protein